MVQRAIGKIQKEIMAVAESNEFLIDYLLAQPRAPGTQNLLDAPAKTNGHAIESIGDAAVANEEMDDGEDWIGLD